MSSCEQTDESKHLGYRHIFKTVVKEMSEKLIQNMFWNKLESSSLVSPSTPTPVVMRFYFALGDSQNESLHNVHAI